MKTQADKSVTEKSKAVANTASATHEARESGAKSFPVWGSGRPRREFLYVDDAAPAGGLTDQDLQRLGEIYDRYLYETDLDHFGDVSDVDDNERIYILLSPTVNALTERGLTGFVSAFTVGESRM